MATSCEDNNWIFDYFTTVNNIAKCDICDVFLKITQARKSEILRHIKTQHRVDYQRIVSSENSQKDLEPQLYIIQDNDMTCKFCYFTFNAKNALYIIRRHLEDTHKIKEDKATEICEWLRKYYFDESDTDMKRRCTICNETILNKPSFLMSHLSKVHEVHVPLENRSVRFLISKNWVWEYFMKSEDQEAKCSVCNEDFILSKSSSNIIYHIKLKHVNMFDVSENSQGNENWHYSITETNQIKCGFCDEIYDLLFYATTDMKTHLVDAHNLNENIAQKLCNWVLEYFHISYLQTSKCNICENMFQTSNSFKLMIHLKEAHQARVSPEIIPARLSSEISSLLYSNRYAQDIVTTSKFQQPTRSFAQSSDCDNFYDQIDESSEIRTTRLLSSSSRLLNFDNNSEDFAASYSYQQPTYSRY